MAPEKGEWDIDSLLSFREKKEQKKQLQLKAGT